MSLSDEFERCKPWLQAALDEGPGTHDIEDIRRGLLTGEYMLMPHPECAVVLEVAEYPRCKALNIFLVGGSLEAFRSLIPQIDAVAIHLNCPKVIGGGRLGFGPKMKDLGFRAKWALYVKELT